MSIENLKGLCKANEAFCLQLEDMKYKECVKKN